MPKVPSDRRGENWAQDLPDSSSDTWDIARWSEGPKLRRRRADRPTPFDNPNGVESESYGELSPRQASRLADEIHREPTGRRRDREDDQW